VNGQPHPPATLLWAKSPLYPLDKRLGGPHRRSACNGEEKNNRGSIPSGGGGEFLTLNRRWEG